MLEWASIFHNNYKIAPPCDIRHKLPNGAFIGWAIFIWTQLEIVWTSGHVNIVNGQNYVALTAMEFPQLIL